MFKKLGEISIDQDTKVIEAMRVIEHGGAQIALVIGRKQQLLGTLTDGDIRRGILHGKKLESPVKDLMNRNFQSAKYSTTANRQEMIKMMKKNFLRHLPVIDKNGNVVELLILEEILNPPEYKNPVVIMAGGKGTRLRPKTKNCPKPMIPVGDKPMLEIQIEKCISNGFKNFYMSVNYLKEQIIDYFEDGSKWGVNIEYLIEEEPLGTAGSLQLLPESISKPIIVINGDVLTKLKPSQLLQFHSSHNAEATLCVREHEISIPFGVIETRGLELSSFAEKPTYRYLVNAGIYVINPRLLQLLSPQTYIDMPAFLQKAQQSEYRVLTCPIHEYWIDVGNPESLEAAIKSWKTN
ncbi:nucleoside-diphosphate-sugar pyrophosphorylase [Synechococcus sp. BL107]|uniref:nucleotidyltransferase family protein n=1 Tax=Synechococcus sp. BL107 TaxID=313625 RepID=UPI0000E53BB7|nr:nucleotidyltransferase family protein [Synechococcus sp. BL107]EAU71031.1 nucleoside-diphosphate-sugar pyrophosphorylase [Synechococcus sp. BL107]